MQRLQINLLKENCIANKIVLLIGPRKVGKRTMVLEALTSLQQTPIEFNAGNKKDKAFA